LGTPFQFYSFFTGLLIVNINFGYRWYFFFINFVIILPYDKPAGVFRKEDNIPYVFWPALTTFITITMQGRTTQRVTLVVLELNIKIATSFPV